MFFLVKEAMTTRGSICPTEDYKGSKEISFIAVGFLFWFILLKIKCVL